jgi:hypothetical protein
MRHRARGYLVAMSDEAVDADRWQVDPRRADTEPDPNRKQVLAVVQILPLPCDEEDVASLISNLDHDTVRRALIELGRTRVRTRMEGSGDAARVVVTAVVHPQVWGVNRLGPPQSV